MELRSVKIHGTDIHDTKYKGKIMNIVIIGTYGHYSYLLEAAKVNSKINITGIAPGIKDENVKDLHDKLAQTYNIKLYSDYKTMLDETSPDIAVINTVFALNNKIAIECLHRKIHCFIEKPVACELDDLEKLKTAYKTSGVHLTAMHEIRYHPWFAAAHKAYQDGLLGEIQLITAQKSYSLGQRPEFYKHRNTYGGTILWVGIHAIDWLYWFTNGEISEITANHTTIGNHNHGELESSALCFYRLKSGGQASINIDYLSPQGRKQHADDRIRIAGTKGLLEVRDNKATISTYTDTYELPLAPKKLIFNEFINYVYNDSKFMLTEDIIFKVTELTILTRIAADQKKNITL